MDEFCGSEFWNYTLTWNTSNPYLTPCFEKTVLVWTPCVFLWVFSLIEFSYLKNSKERNVPWNILSFAKLIFSFLLIVLTIVDLALAIKDSTEQEVPTVEIVTPIIKLVSFIFTVVLFILNKKRGLRTSGLLFIFWFLLIILSIPQFRTQIGNISNSETAEYEYISYIIYFSFIIFIFVLNIFVDSEPKISPYEKQENQCPERQSSFLSRLFYAWFDALIWKGYKNPLTRNDLWSLNPQDTSGEIIPIFEKYWNKSRKEADEYNLKHANDKPKKSKPNKVKPDETDPKKTSEKKILKASIVPAMVKSFGATFLFGSFLKLTQDLMIFIQPQLLKLMIGFVGGDDYEWKGYLYAVALFVVAMIQTLVLAQYFQKMYIVGMRIRTALIGVIYKKALKLSNSARKESTVGEIVNLMSVDAQKFIELIPYISMVWSAPLQIALALYFLYEQLGASVFAGLGVMIILIPINAVIATKSKGYQVTQMKNKDERVKLMNEIINGIKVIKLYAWEPSFEKEITKIRDREISVLKILAYFSTTTMFLWTTAPFLVTLITFVTYVLSDPENNILTADKAFVSLSLFNILRFPLMMLPAMIFFTIQAIVSIKRLNKFLNAEEINSKDIEHEPNEETPLSIENGTFSWGTEEEKVLRDINVKIKKGSLVAVVGTVGSGKSSLISAFLGDTNKISGRVNTHGTIAYVAQQAWIQNATVQDNILFGNDLNKDVYDSVIDSCALKPDLEILPGGDLTEIGEKGINLSGGQKQRVSLARAVYCDSDVYFLDDPLSAVDTHVGKHIFDKVIGPKGLLKGKTRVLVTHGITFLPEVDHIIVIKDGEVSESGTYKNLLENKAAFSEFIAHHTNESQDTVESDEIEADKSSKELLRGVSQVSDVKTKGDEVHKDAEETDESSKNKLIQEEVSETGNVKLKVFVHYFKSVGWFYAIAAILGNMAYQGFAVGSDIWLSIWTSDEDIWIDENTLDTAKRDRYLGGYGGFGIGQIIFVSISSLSLFIGALRASRYLHSQMLKSVLRAPAPSFFDVTPVGRILNRFGKDVDTLDNVLPNGLNGWLTCFFIVIATLIVITVSTPIFAAVIVPLGIIYFLVQRVYIATSRQLKREESVTRSPIYSHFGETITGVSVIRAFGRQNRFIDESEQKVDINQMCYYPSIIANRWLAVRLEIVGNFIIFFSALFAVLARGTVNTGLAALSITYSLQITQMLNWLVRITSEVETNIVSAERIKEYIEVTREAEWEIEETKPNPEWPEKGEVIMDNLEIRYRETTEPVLHSVSFDIKPQEKVGIVGRTGAGKSTLTLALFRILEASGGKIIIDGIDISKLGLHALRNRLTIIPQDPVLFSGTIRSNLDPFNTFNDDDVWRALEHSHLKPFVKGLNLGLAHEINEGGDNLSVGQRQLFCLARALLRKSRVLILDEATAAVDLETDDLIQKTIRTEFSSCTVLTIAHRLNTIMDSTRVLVLDKGKLAEFDTPEKLLADRKSIFYGMAKDAGLVN